MSITRASREQRHFSEGKYESLGVIRKRIGGFGDHHVGLAKRAQVNDKAPKPIIEFTTTQIMSIIEEAPEYFDEDPDRFYGEIGSVLDATIDWRGFTKGVMGEYASNARYKSLDADGKKALRAQLESFTDIIKSGLIRTYAKGLLAFSGSKFEIVDADDIEPNARSASITQLVYGSGDQTYTIRYQMGKRRDGSATAKSHCRRY